MQDLLGLLIGAILLAGLYATMSYGLALIYGVMKVINLAHAGTIMFGAYTAFTLQKSFGVDPLLSPLLVVPTFFVFGMVVQRVLVRRLMKAPPIATLLLLFGVWLVLQNTAYIIWTGDTRAILTSYTYSKLWVFGAPIGVSWLVVFAVGIFSLVLLHQLLTRTYIGKAIRAAAQEQEACQLVGINVDRVMAVAFGLGYALSGLAGALMSVLYSFAPDFGGEFLLKSFCITVLGGVESMVGVGLGSLVLALAESFGGRVLPATLQNMISFVLLVVVLVATPGGLIGLVRRR